MTAMTATRSLEGSPDTLHKIGSLSMVAFAIVTFAFYVSLVQAGYDPGLGLLACTSAGIAFLLLRVEKRVAPSASAAAISMTREEALDLPNVGEEMLAEGQLLVHVDNLLRGVRSAKGEVGVMFVAVHSPNVYGSSPHPGVINLIRGRLNRDAGTKVFRLDEETLAIAERRPGVATHMERLSAALHDDLRSRAQASPELSVTQITVGVALTDDPKASVASLFTSARSATRLAFAHGRDSFFRLV